MGTAGAYSVDLARLDRVAARAVKGLFLHHYERRLPDDYEVIAYTADGLTASGRADVVNTVVAPVLRTDRHEIGGDVFEYWFQADPNMPNVSGWLLRFFRSVDFAVITLPRESVGKAPRLVRL